MKQLALAMMIAFSAAPVVAGNEAQAMKLYEQGEALYKKGKFADALKAFQKAYRLEPAPLLYVNIAQCHRQLGNHEAAVEALERYLAEDPEGEMKAEVEEILAQERAILHPPVAELETTPEPEPEPAPPPQPATTTPATTTTTPAQAEDDGLLSSPGLWIAVGGTALVLAASGAVVAIVASQPPPPPPTGSLGTFDLR